MSYERNDYAGGSGGWAFLGGLVLGAAGGFLVGALAAPRASSETRERLDDVRERTNDLIDSLRGNTETLLNSTRTAIEEKISMLNEAVEAGRKAAEYKRAELIEQDP